MSSAAAPAGGPGNPPSGGDAAARAAIDRIARGEILRRDEARALMESIFAGGVTQAQIGAILIGLRTRGVMPEEIVGLVEAMRAAGKRLEISSPDAIDLCGTGGDASGSINISTGASLVAAAAGAHVAKHGNRAATSRAGSADVLEAMGIPIDLSPERARAAIDGEGFAFLFAPAYHPSMRIVAGPRRELGTWSVFNLLGPLANPAGVRRQLIGVFADEIRVLLSYVLRTLGCERAWIVHSPLPPVGGVARGLDEIGIEGPTRVLSLEGGRISELEISPEDAGLTRRPGADLAGGDAAANGRRLAAILAGEKGAARDAVVLNAAAGIHLAGIAADLREGRERAEAAIDSGRTKDLLERLRRFR